MANWAAKWHSQSDAMNACSPDEGRCACTGYFGARKALAQGNHLGVGKLILSFYNSAPGATCPSSRSPS